MGGEEIFSFDGGWIAFIAVVLILDVAMFYIGRKFTRKI